MCADGNTNTDLIHHQVIVALVCIAALRWREEWRDVHVHVYSRSKHKCLNMFKILSISQQKVFRSTRRQMKPKGLWERPHSHSPSWTPSHQLSSSCRCWGSLLDAPYPRWTESSAEMKVASIKGGEMGRRWRCGGGGGNEVRGRARIPAGAAAAGGSEREVCPTDRNHVGTEGRPLMHQTRSAPKWA